MGAYSEQGYANGEGCTYHGAVADLDGLQQVQHQLSTLAGEDQTVTEGGSAVDLVGEVDGLERGGQVGDDTGHTNVEGLPGDLLKAEGVLDDFLYPRCAISFHPTQTKHPRSTQEIDVPLQTSCRPSRQCLRHPITRTLAIEYPACSGSPAMDRTLAEEEA